MAKKSPSIKNSKPIAVINSFKLWTTYLFTAGFIDLPKNLKKSLSGDKTNEVSPPINAIS